MYEYNATILRVIDGETVEATVDLGFSTFFKSNFRLFGIDTPELHSSVPAVRELATRAKSRLIELIEGQTVLVRTHKPDKYGRWLVEIKTPDITLGTVNSQLIAEGFAKPYLGVGERPIWP